MQQLVAGCPQLYFEQGVIVCEASLEQTSSLDWVFL